MDILTERGQVSLADEQVVANWINSQNGWSYVQTPKKSPAAVDAVLVKNNEIIAVVEAKCRYDLDSLEQFQVNYKNEWLVTWSKISKGIDIAEKLCVPFVGYLYLAKPKVLLCQKISDNDGLLVTDIRLSTTSTQATINGGKAMRVNAYISMKKAKIFNLES
jgi:hypothetical protein